MDAFNRILGRVIDFCTGLGTIAIVFMMLQICIDVFAKYVIGMPTPGTITMVSNYYMVLVAFLPLAFTERRNGHISVEVMVEHFSPNVQRALNVFALVFSILVFGAITWQSLIEANRAYAIGTFEIEVDYKLLTWPARYLLPFGCALMTLTLLAKLAVAVRDRSRLELSKPYF